VLGVLTMLASYLGEEGAASVLAFSVLGGVTMLDPNQLGLPANTQSVPYVMALVISHLLISGVALIFIGYQLEKGFRFKTQESGMRDSRRAQIATVWKSAFHSLQPREEQRAAAAPHMALYEHATHISPMTLARYDEAGLSVNTELEDTKFVFELQGGAPGRAAVCKPPAKAGSETEVAIVEVAIVSPGGEEVGPSPPPSPSEFLEDEASRPNLTRRVQRSETPPSALEDKNRQAGQAGLDQTERGALMRLLGALPTLLHYATQSQLSEPTHPQGEGFTDGYDFKTHKHSEFSKTLADVQLHFRYFLTPAYLIIWGMISIIYLAF